MQHTLCTFLCLRCTTTTWKYLISRFVDDVTQDNDFLFRFLNPDAVFSNSSQERLIERDGISAIKLSEVFAAIAVVVAYIIGSFSIDDGNGSENVSC